MIYYIRTLAEKQDNKTTYIASIKEGKSVYNKIDVEEILVRDYGKLP